MNQFNNNNNNININSNNNQDNKVKVDNYIKKLEELEAVVEKQVSDIKYFAPTIPIIGVSSTVGVNFQGEEEEEDDDEEEEDDDATRVLGIKYYYLLLLTITFIIDRYDDG